MQVGSRQFTAWLVPGQPVVDLCHSYDDSLAAGTILARALHRIGYDVSVKPPLQAVVFPAAGQSSGRPFHYARGMAAVGQREGRRDRRRLRHAPDHAVLPELKHKFRVQSAGPGPSYFR